MEAPLPKLREPLLSNKSEDVNNIAIIIRLTVTIEERKPVININDRDAISITLLNSAKSSLLTH